MNIGKKLLKIGLQQIKNGEVDVKKWRKNNKNIEGDYRHWKSY